MLDYMGRMTLDDRISILERVIENTHHMLGADEGMIQLVEWLKELKVYKEADCISREDAIGIVARIKEMHIDDREQYPINYGTICDIDLALQQLPPITPQPKMGRWKYVQYDNNPNIGNWHCSECRGICTEMHSIEDAYNYCPDCGAKMEVEE
jgi:hypothetical protein